MKELTNIQRAIQFLNKVFKGVNETYFNNDLEMPVITIQTSVGAYGHITVDKVWQTDGIARYELNIGAETLNRPIENVVTTMIHECVHLYCLMNNIKDTSNNGVYHNKKFKKIAEEMGHIQITKHEKYGFTISEPTEETIRFCLDYGFDDIKISRKSPYYTVGTTTTTTPTSTNTPKVRKPSSTRKYICPCCGNSFRATKQINVLCMDCNEQYIVAD
ncbi:MAG: SprT-like domain-containing protein [Clostridium sp.]|nr:SprT-like domain-containing protein [Clostridium sp.]